MDDESMPHTRGQRCKAKCKATGEQCKKWAMTGGSVCRAHGGASLRGPALPQYKFGVYAKRTHDLSDVVEGMERADLTRELVLTRTALHELLDRHGLQTLVEMKGGSQALLAYIEQIRRIVDRMRRRESAIEAVAVRVEDTGILEAIADIIVERFGMEVAVDIWEELRARAPDAGDLRPGLPGGQ